jgi:hypothetical protein
VGFCCEFGWLLFVLTAEMLLHFFRGVWTFSEP